MARADHKKENDFHRWNTTRCMTLYNLSIFIGDVVRKLLGLDPGHVISG